ncbi:MAG TPA: 2-amino-4-hydroxy-6-hydroxymethyldihydropteridine diphosphokinase [Burkholderiales bacterium]|nr:2-amino-4-hydroxy-6-hydroxymethyldihydropteridine diphosphokinase [Burkholderiales bacterium]
MTLVYIGIGSNLDDPRRQVLDAFDELDQLPHSRLVRRSSLYRTAPVGHAAQPDFINAVAELETGLPAERLLVELQAIEARHGRARSFANAPRTLDLDLLMLGAAELSTAALTVPHPRMHERAFVLKPLLEISPGLEIPGRGAAQAFLDACSGQQVQRID